MSPPSANIRVHERPWWADYTPAPSRLRRVPPGKAPTVTKLTPIHRAAVYFDTPQMRAAARTEPPGTSIVAFTFSSAFRAADLRVWHAPDPPRSSQGSGQAARPPAVRHRAGTLRGRRSPVARFASL